MMVEEYDPPARYLVSSAKEPGMEYLVDLFEHDGAGTCSCYYFKYKIEPNYYRADKKGVFHCKHILAAKIYLVDKIIYEAIQIAKKTGQKSLTKKGN